MRARRAGYALVVLGVACALVLPGCRREPEGPIYSVEDDIPEKTELKCELTRTIESGLARLKGVAVSGDGRIYAVGAGGVNVLDAQGKLITNWKSAKALRCIALGEDGTVYVASPGRITKFDSTGVKLGSWETAATGVRLGQITSLSVRGIELLAADADAKCVHRFTVDGDYSNRIPMHQDEGKASSGLILPSAYLDCALDARGNAVINHPGKMHVETYSLEGKLLKHWGRPGMDAEGFCGCCNPTDIALTSTGNVVTAEKGIFRVKVYNDEGKMLAFIAQEFFSRKTAGLDIAVDGVDRIYVADPGDGRIRVFTVTKRDREN